jgi:hypothetical protein
MIEPSLSPYLILPSPYLIGGTTGPHILGRLANLVKLPLIFSLLGAITAGIFLSTTSVSAQNRDHLTEQETQLVRDNQELDKRIDIFIKAVDRRFAIINGTAQPTPKKEKKDAEDWGDLPKGSRTDLLSDIAGILDEAITNIDNVSQRDAKNPLISKSLRKLTSASKGYLNQLAALKNQAKDADELSAIERVANNANEIVEVGSKLPTPSPESDKKKKKPCKDRRQKAVGRKQEVGVLSSEW